MGKQIRLMSHNVWNCDNNHPAWKENGEDCSAAARVSGLIQVYLDTKPDIIGGQEVSALMADLLKEGCRDVGLDYTLIWGRFTPILYRADKFELLDSVFTTYPEAIDGFEGSFNDVKSKAFNIGVFREKETGAVFLFATTHLWWMSSNIDDMFSLGSGYQAGSDEAREYQVQMLAAQVTALQKKYNCPAVVVGDFNTDYRSKAMQYLLADGFRHAHDIAVEYAEESIGYHNCFPSGYDRFFSEKPFECAIDHIVVRGAREDAVKRFARYSPEYYYPISDHSPVYIDLEL